MYSQCFCKADLLINVKNTISKLKIYAGTNGAQNSPKVDISIVSQRRYILISSHREAEADFQLFAGAT